LSEILQVEIQKALIGIKSPEDALNTAAEAAKKLKEKNK
jgi:ABC-type glycerol-3-phosphate transport system substrate-binding protein